MIITIQTIITVTVIIVWISASASARKMRMQILLRANFLAELGPFARLQ